jgi:large subunit ribosomal protein L13
MRTYVATQKDIKRKWYIVDAKDKVLGRLAVRIADVLRGKDKAIYTPHVDTGDHVIVINADKVKFTGNKLKNKTYDRYSGYPGGRKVESLETLLKRKPTEVLVHAVKGMVPDNSLGRDMLKKLKVYAGCEHPHSAQGPFVELKLS